MITITTECVEPKCRQRWDIPSREQSGPAAIEQARDLLIRCLKCGTLLPLGEVTTPEPS